MRVEKSDEYYLVWSQMNLMAPDKVFVKFSDLVRFMSDKFGLDNVYAKQEEEDNND